MNFQRKAVVHQGSKMAILLAMSVAVWMGCLACSADFPAADTNVRVPPATTPVSSSCACATTTTGSGTTSVATTPVSPTVAAPIVVDTLIGVAPPRFVPNGGNLYVGTPVRITADSLPPQAVIEYSVDGGQQWKTGQQFALIDGGSLLTRIRLGTRTTRFRSTPFSVYFNRVLIIGNSIMSHAPDASIGWTNFNGMAASAPSNDFVHLLTQRLRLLQPAVQIKLQSGGDFERNYVNFKLTDWNEPLSFVPDLIIIRIAENIDESSVDRLNLETYYRNMLTKLVGSSKTVKVVCSTSFWYQPRTDAIIKKVAAEKGVPVAELCKLVGRPEYMALQYKDIGVAKHPNDAGMQQIADLLWAAVQ